MTRVRATAVVAAALGAYAVLEWLLQGGFLRLVMEEPVLLGLFPGLPLAFVFACLIPQRPRVVRVPAPTPPERPLEVTVTHQHVHQVEVTHRHVMVGTVTDARPVSRGQLTPAPVIIDGSVASEAGTVGSQ